MTPERLDLLEREAQAHIHRCANLDARLAFRATPHGSGSIVPDLCRQILELAAALRAVNGWSKAS